MKKLLMVLGIFLPAIFCAQNKVIDSLQALLKLAPQDTVRANLLNRLSDKCTDAGNFDQALTFAKDAHTLSTRLGYISGIAWANYMTGRATWKKGDLEASLPYYLKAERLHAVLADTPALAKTQATLGLLYTYHIKFPQSMKYLYKALALYEILGDSECIAKVNNNIGLSYSKQYKSAKSIPYYERALKGFRRLKNPPIELQTLMNLGGEYQRQNLQRSIEYLNEALDLATRIGDAKSRSSVLLNLGVSYRTAGDTAKSQEYFVKALELKKQLNDKEGIAVALMDIGVNHQYQHRPQEAIRYFEEAHAIAKEIKSSERMHMANYHLGELYETTKNYKEAVAALKLELEYRYSLFNRENTKKVVEAEVNFDFEKKKLALKAEAEKREAIYQEESRRQRTMIIAVVAVLVLGLCIALLFIRQIKYRNEQRADQLEHKLLRTQMNPHFIYNSLNAIQLFVLQNNARDAARYLSSFAKLTRAVLENSRMEQIQVQKEIALLENYMQLQKLRFSDRFEYTIHLDPALDAENTLIPPMLSQPFIENALEHGMKDITTGGRIEVSFTKKENRLLLEVKDNGKGLVQLSDQLKKHQSLATSITEERIELINRKETEKIVFTVTEAYPQEMNKGVKVSFSIPLRTY